MAGVAVIGALAACLSVFISDCMEEGMILDWWLPGILNTRTGRSMQACRRFLDGQLPWWMKPLGGCVYCMNAWVTAAVFLLCEGPLAMLPLAVGVSHVAVRAVLAHT